ncbi:MAG: hypothetical protein PHI35_09280 [Victivallaceae bacterium]|nr:hypothetical protein [Victivallaceae bacterium]
MVAITSLLLAAESGLSYIGNVIGEGTIVTLGGVCLLLVIVRNAKGLWDSFKAEPPHPDLATKAELYQVITAQATLATRVELQTVKHDLTGEINVSRAERKRATDELFEQTRSILVSIGTLSADINRALGRVEGRQETVEALRKIIHEEKR